MTLGQLKEAINKLNLLSNAFFLLVMMFATLGAGFILWKGNTNLTPDLYFSAILCLGFATVLLLIEILTRYRSILYPAITIQATYGLYFFSEYFRRSHKKGAKTTSTP